MGITAMPIQPPRIQRPIRQLGLHLGANGKAKKRVLQKSTCLETETAEACCEEV